MRATRGIFLGIAVVLGFLLSQPAGAISCNIVSIAGVNFGVYDVFSVTPTDSAGAVTYRCTGVGTSTVTMHLSSGSSGSYSPRRMFTFGDSLPYNLYLDAARTMIWGDGTGGTSFYGPIRPPNNRNVTVTVYGRIPPGQDVLGRPLYLDIVTVTLNF